MALMYKPVGNTINRVPIDLPLRDSSDIVSRVCYEVAVFGQDYMACKNAKFHSSEKKNDDYGKAISFPDGTGDTKTAFGLFGEVAIATLFGLEVDMEYKVNGDDCDFVVGNEKWDAKTSIKLGDRPNIIGMRYNRYVKLKDKYLLCFMRNLDFEKQYVDVVAVGFVTKEHIEPLQYFTSVYDKKSSSEGRSALNFDVYYSESKLLEDI